MESLGITNKSAVLQRLGHHCAMHGVNTPLRSFLWLQASTPGGLLLLQSMQRLQESKHFLSCSGKGMRQLHLLVKHALM
jgi:hypothetical protein